MKVIVCVETFPIPTSSLHRHFLFIEHSDDNPASVGAKDVGGDEVVGAHMVVQNTKIEIVKIQKYTLQKYRTE